MKVIVDDVMTILQAKVMREMESVRGGNDCSIIKCFKEPLEPATLRPSTGIKTHTAPVSVCLCSTAPPCGWNDKCPFPKSIMLSSIMCFLLLEIVIILSRQNGFFFLLERTKLNFRDSSSNPVVFYFRSCSHGCCGPHVSAVVSVGGELVLGGFTFLMARTVFLMDPTSG